MDSNTILTEYPSIKMNWAYDFERNWEQHNSNITLRFIKDTNEIDFTPLLKLDKIYPIPYDFNINLDFS